MYTIKIKEGPPSGTLIEYLDAAVHGSRFTAAFTHAGPGEIHVKPVRLKESKPYCGQHPGECDVGPRRRGKWLEWDDWVEFHALVNAVLDEQGVSADVWTNPPERMDVGRKLFVRRGAKARVRYDYEREFNGFRHVATWNHGTPDQFD